MLTRRSSQAFLDVGIVFLEQTHTLLANIIICNAQKLFRSLQKVPLILVNYKLTAIISLSNAKSK